MTPAATRLLPTQEANESDANEMKLTNSETLLAKVIIEFSALIENDSLSFRRD
jgi:hypothetical protein